jgi:hypothetical protein
MIQWLYECGTFDACVHMQRCAFFEMCVFRRFLVQAEELECF